MSTCSHGVPRMYVCPDGDHANHTHHKCDDNGGVVRMVDLDHNERAVILALINARDAAVGRREALAADSSAVSGLEPASIGPRARPDSRSE